MVLIWPEKVFYNLIVMKIKTKFTIFSCAFNGNRPDGLIVIINYL